MQKMSEIRWLRNLKPRLLLFLEHQKSKKIDGYFRYSYTGDLFNEEKNWGLGASIFAAKIMYILDEVKNLDDKYKNNWVRFIKSFGNNKDGEFYDKLILKKSGFYRKVSSLKNLNFNNWSGNLYKRAETRRVWEGLFFLGSQPDYLYKKIPQSIKGIEQYFYSLNWKKPWGAASHVNHLLFFLHNSQKLFNCNNKELIKFTLDYLSKYQSKEDGSWYEGKGVPYHDKINAAMKICMGFHSLKIYEIPNVEKLIDLCLKEKIRMDACNVVNLLYVLYSCSLITDYKKEKIREFAEKSIRLFRQFFHKEQGGFSFYLNRSNNKYYGATVSKGLDEADIHGTSMFLWGIALASKILGIDKELNLRVPIVSY